MESVVPIDTHPLFTKKYLYRTRKALQSEMVILRSPSPQPLEERAEEDLTPEEMRELIRKQKVSLEEPWVGPINTRRLNLLSRKRRIP